MPKKKSRRNSGEGSIYYAKERKCYIGRIPIGRNEKGKLRYKKVSGPTIREVARKMDAIKYRILDGSFVDVNRITFEQLAKQMLEERFKLNEIKQNTYYRQVETLKMMKEICYVPIQEINEFMIKDFLLKQVYYSDSVLRKMILILKMVFKEAVKRKIIAYDPMIDIKRPKSNRPARKIRALTLTEQIKLEAILKEKPCDYSLQMLLSLYTGCRMGEINALKFEDYDQINNRLYIRRTVSRGKTGEAVINAPKTAAGLRSFTLSEEAKEVLNQAIAVYNSSGYNDNYLFHDKAGKLPTTSAVNLQFKRILEKYHIPESNAKGELTCHSLRHTFATRCIESGISAKVVSSKLGHTDITVTLNTYSDCFDIFESTADKMFDDYMARMKAKYDEKGGLTIIE